MKERITLQKLMEEGWIPILTGTLSAGVIVSLAHSTGMAYVTALLLMALYFVAIAANRLNAKVVAEDIGLRILHRAVQNIGEARCIKALQEFKKQFLRFWLLRIDLAKYRILEAITKLIARFTSLSARLSSILSGFIGPELIVVIRRARDLLKTGMNAIGKVIQSFNKPG